MERWGEKECPFLIIHLKQTYGEKLYKLASKRRDDLPQPRRHTWRPGLHFLQRQQVAGRFCRGTPVNPYRQQIEAGKALIRQKPDAAFVYHLFRRTQTLTHEVSYLEKIFSRGNFLPRR